MYWKLATMKCIGKAMIGFILSIAQALNGLEWSNQTGTQKFIMLSLAVGQAWSVVDAFLDTTMQTLSAKEKQAIANDTESPDAIVRTETITEVKS